MGKAIVQTIPELLVETRGNMAAVGRMTGIARQTVKCYARDVDGKKTCDRQRRSNGRSGESWSEKKGRV